MKAAPGSLTSAFGRIARAISQNHQVEIVDSAGELKTDGQRIWIPVTTELAQGVELAALNGMLDHELGHVLVERDNDVRDLPSFVERLRKAHDEDPRLGFILNCVEDLRMEAWLVAKLPGTRLHLEAVRDLALARKTAPSDPWVELGQGIYSLANELSLDWMTPAGRVRLARVADLVPAITAASSSVESEMLAREIHQRLLDTPSSEEPNKGAGGGSEGEVEAGGAPGRPLSGDDWLNEPCPGDWREEVTRGLLERLRARAVDSGRWFTHPDALSGDGLRAFLSVEPDRARERWDKARRDAGRSSSLLKRRLLSLSQIRASSSRAVGLDEGDLDPARLASVDLGARDIFMQQRPGRELDVAFSLLVDLSGSLAGFVRHVAATVVALADAWEPLNGVAYEVLSFQTTRSVSSRKVEPPFYWRHPTDYGVFKAFGERLGALRARLRLMQPRGDNHDCDAVIFAARRLALQSAPRKVLIVLSDGHPECSSTGLSRLDQAKLLRASVRRIVDAGIEVWGIGVGYEGVARDYSAEVGARNVWIKDFKTMPTELLRLFSGRTLAAA